MSWDYKNKILFIYRYGAWCGSATRQSSEILVSVYSAQHISFNLLALENHTLLLGLNVFFSFLYYIQYCRFLVLLLSQFTATKPQEVHLCKTFLPLKTFSDIFFWISLNHFLYFAYIIENSIRFSKLIESKTSSAYTFKNFKSWLVYYNYIAKIFYCGDLLPKSAMPKFAYIFCALLCSVGRWFHQGHKNVLMLFS